VIHRGLPANNVSRARLISIVAAAFAALSAAATPTHAQEYELFNRFSFAFEGSWAVMDSVIRLDSEALGKGTELDFENDGGLDSSKLVPTLSFEWMMGSRHRLGGWWMKVDRDSTRTILEEIRWGDKVFPIEEEVRFLLGNEEIALSYTYVAVLKPRHAFGIGGGFRITKTTAGLAARELEISEEGDFTAPLPFFGFEYRFGISPKWRLISNLGVFYIEIGDFSGSQIVFDGWAEYLAFKRVSFGGGLRFTRIDADMTTGTEIAGNFRGYFKAGTLSSRLFVRVRF
jgi:hypothetical protein